MKKHMRFHFPRAIPRRWASALARFCQFGRQFGPRVTLVVGAVALAAVAGVALAGAAPKAYSGTGAGPGKVQKARQASKPAKGPAGNAANGRRLFKKDGCYECHGYEAQGSPTSGPRLGPDPIPLAAMIAYVRHPTGQMPPYTAKVLSDKQLTDMYAFLKSLPHPPPVSKIPLLH